MQSKYIGNIITTYPKDTFPSFFNVVTDMKDKIDGIPTMVVGLENARVNINSFSILKKSYDDTMVWWTYKKTERRYEFEQDIEDYYRFCFKKFFNKIRYYYIDLPSYSLSALKRLIRWIMSDNPKTCFLTRESNFLFIYDSEKEIVFGLSLTLVEYMGVDRKKVVLRIKANKHNRFIYDTSFMKGEIRKIVENNTHYILPLSVVLSNA